ncbi:unannotated protein [freshwater metagenome]|uniref:Unannotated protein n=1 Tax=freshwater metagenome TaxID=449393 RepID=A0A6J7UEZ2_9ZZZZ
MSNKIAAGAFIVIEVEILSSGRPSNSRRMSESESMATPTLPTSSNANGASESMPICVGKSNATDNPPVPAATNSL